MRETYEDTYGNERCSICHGKIEGGYCDCIAYEIQKETNKTRIQDIALEVATLVDRKNADYDRAFEKSISKYGMTSYCIRLEDKLNRIYSLAVKGNEQQVSDESVIDTLKDIIGYSLLALEIYENKR